MEDEMRLESVVQGRVFVLLVFQIVWITLALFSAVKIPADTWFLRGWFVVLSLPPAFLYWRTFPFIKPGFYVLVVNQAGISIKRGHKRFTMDWHEIEHIEYRPFIIGIGLSRWAQTVLTWRNGEKFSKISIPDIFLYPQKKNLRKNTGD